MQQLLAVQYLSAIIFSFISIQIFMPFSFLFWFKLAYILLENLFMEENKINMSNIYLKLFVSMFDVFILFYFINECSN